MYMSIHASGYIDTQLATTVAYLLNTSIERAQRLIDDFRGLDETDAGTLAVVADLIMTSVNSHPASEDVTFAAAPPRRPTRADEGLRQI